MNLAQQTVSDQGIVLTHYCQLDYITSHFLEEACFSAHYCQGVSALTLYVYLMSSVFDGKCENRAQQTIYS